MASARSAARSLEGIPSLSLSLSLVLSQPSPGPALRSRALRSSSAASSSAAASFSFWTFGRSRRSCPRSVVGGARKIASLSSSPLHSSAKASGTAAAAAAAASSSASSSSAAASYSSHSYSTTTPSSSSSSSSTKRDFDLKGWGRGRYYTKTHEWFEVVDDGVGVVGITQAAQQALGEVVFCRLPKIGDRLKTMDTLATLEAVKTVGEVKAPVYGEVIEINPRLEREPALVTFAPLTEGWLVRMAFSGKIPKYLQRSRAVSRADIEHVVEDAEAIRTWLSEHLLVASSGPSGADDGEEELPEAARGLQQLTFDGLNSKERFLVHEAAEDLGLPSTSRGVGASRQLIVRRPPPPEKEGEGDEDEDEDEGFGPQGWTNESDPPTGLERSPGPRTNRERRGE